LIHSDAKLAPTTTYSNATAEAREYLRVVLWNDDPAVLFFEDDDNDNWNFTLGGVKDWYCDHFKWGDGHERNENSDNGHQHY